MKANATLFDYINDILVYKKGDLTLDSYVPFLINRWLSFINPFFNQFVNQFNSKILLENKELHYKIMVASFPKLNRAPRIHYVKKSKEEQNEESKKVEFLAKGLEISKREALLLLGESTSE